VRKFDAACHVGYDPLQEVGTSPEELERILDRHEVAKAVLLPMGAGLIHRFREQNRELARLSAGSSRYLFYCTVNPWFETEALEELDLCFGTLGAAGLAFDTSRQGLYIDSPMIFPLIEEAARRAKPVYFFTGMPIFALPLNLANLARRFPEVQFIMGAMGVSDYWGDISPAVRLAPNIHLETSVNTNVPAVLPSFIEEFGDRNILFGSSYPYTDYEMEYRKIERAGLPPDSLERIFCRNACGLFGIGL
jgi:predicted TIM-barrel fold metal-dependent hydrolase